MAEIKHLNPNNQILADALHDLLDLANRGQLKAMVFAASDKNDNTRLIFFSDTFTEKVLLVNELQMHLVYDKMKALAIDEGVLD